MSFLTKYLEQNKLPPLRRVAKKRLERVEKNLDVLTQGKDQFSDIIQDYIPRIVRIVERIRVEFNDWKFSVGNLVSAFRFVVDIAKEVSEIVQEISDRIVPDDAAPEQVKQIKIAFGQELTYFIYLLWDPRLVKWIPIGIESWVEKKIIYWLSGMILDLAFDRETA